MPDFPTRTPDLREALLGQLAYLVDEIEAVKALVDRVPVAIQEARPLPQDLSLKETYGLLATLDETVYLPGLQRMMAEEAAAFEAVDEAALAAGGGWHEHPLDAILKRVQDARRRLVAFLRAIPPEAWTRTAPFGDAHLDLYGLAHHIIQHDVDLLRAIGYRLHESRPLGQRRMDV